MPRRPSPPTYPKKPHASGQARVKFFGTHRYLGVWGSPESYAAWRKLLLEWEDIHAGRQKEVASEVEPGRVVTVGDLVARFVTQGMARYLQAGKLSKEGTSMRQALKPLGALYGRMAVADFSAREMLDLRGHMLSGDWLRPDEIAARQRRGGRARHFRHCRRTVNRDFTRIKTFWRWCEFNELIPEGRLTRLCSVPGLQPGEDGAVDYDDVPPVDEAILEATLPHLPPQIRPMVDLLLLTGARIGELLRMKIRDVQREGRIELARGVVFESAGCWVYRPRRHKTAHLGHHRIVLFGPKAQAILRQLTAGRAADEFVFESPRTAGRYAKVIIAACARAFPLPEKIKPVFLERNGRPGRRRRERLPELRARLSERDRGHLEEWLARHRWHPHQLRHNAATRLVAQFGWEVARILLGHRSVETTRIYAQDSLTRAAEAMHQTG